jgi:anti-anti-sigma factor
VGTEHHRPAEPVQPVSSSALDGIAVTVESLAQQWRVVHVTGELDMVTAPALRAVVTEVFDDGLLAGRTLVFDLTSVDFMGSSGLGVLAEAVQRAEAAGLPPIRVVLASRAVRRAVEVTGMDAVLAVFPDLATATAD